VITLGSDELAFSSISEALKFGHFDLAIVAIPNDQHFVTIKELLFRRVPVLKEKPLALSCDEMEAYDLLSNANLTALIVAQQRRYHPAFQLLKKWLPLIGRPRYADYTFCINDKNNSWYWDKARGGGCWLGLGWHACWLFSFLFGKGRDLTLTRLGGKKVGWTYDTEDTCLLSGLFSESCAVRALLSVTSPVKKEELLLEGTEGVISLSRNSISLFAANGDRIEHRDVCVNNADLYIEQLRSTFDALASGLTGIDQESRLAFDNHFQAAHNEGTEQKILAVSRLNRIEVFTEENLR
jgi:predicted dehydrogenase